MTWWWTLWRWFSYLNLTQSHKHGCLIQTRVLRYLATTFLEVGLVSKLNSIYNSTYLPFSTFSSCTFGEYNLKYIVTKLCLIYSPNNLDWWQRANTMTHRWSIMHYCMYFHSVLCSKNVLFACIQLLRLKTQSGTGCW